MESRGERVSNGILDHDVGEDVLLLVVAAFELSLQMGFLVCQDWTHIFVVGLRYRVFLVDRLQPVFLRSRIFVVILLVISDALVLDGAGFVGVP